MHQQYFLLIHQFSLIFNALLLTPVLIRIKKKKVSKVGSVFSLFLISIIAFNFPSYFNKLYIYFTLPDIIITPAKGTIFVWIINFVPAVIFLCNIKRFKFDDYLNKILIIFSILEILLLPLVFFKSVVAYRLILYIFPSSLLITSKLPDIKLFKIESHYFVKGIIFLAFLNLIIWTNYAYHAYCWIHYKSLILN